MRAGPPLRASPPLRVGLVGLGVISRFYLGALAAGGPARLAAVCDRRPEALAPHADAVPGYTDHREMIAAGGLDAVVVTAPNDAHAPLCRDLLTAGLPVCVEKPLALTPAEGGELVALALAHRTTLFTSFHRRYNARVRELLDALPPGVPVVSARVRYLELIEEHAGADAWYLDPARCGGGCVADNGPNAFDLVRLLVGACSVSSVDVKRDGAGVDRWARVGLRARSGATAEVELDWSYPGEVKDVEVRLADGSVLRADLLAGFDGFKQSLWHEYAGVLDAFASAVGDRGPDPAGLAALELVDAVYRAERGEA